MNTLRKSNGLAAGIIVLALAAVIIHFYLNVRMGKLDILFTLNGFGYLAFLAALFLPLPVVKDNNRLVRFGMIGYTLLTIILWVFLGKPYTPLGYVTKVIEFALVILLGFKKP